MMIDRSPRIVQTPGHVGRSKTKKEVDRKDLEILDVTGWEDRIQNREDWRTVNGGGKNS